MAATAIAAPDSPDARAPRAARAAGATAGRSAAATEAPLAPATGLPAAAAAAPAPKPAPWPPPALNELPDRNPARASVDRAWRLPAKSLAERVSRTERASMALGLRDLDGPARGLLFLSDEGSALERAELAVVLAPGLPAAHAALARARLDAGDLPGALAALTAAIEAAPAQLEARAWFSAVSGAAATYAGLALAALFALLGAAASLPALTYGLGATRLKLAGPAALASLGALVMGLALIEGPAGAVLGLGALAIASGDTAKRVGVAVALAAGLFALHAGFERIAAGRLLLVGDPVAAAVQRIEAGLPTPPDVGLALRAAPSDLDAASAVAILAKRSGDRDTAAQYFARVIARRPDAALYNNAANVAFARGDVARAISLYEQAVELTPSATEYFNLAQAYGRAIRLDDQDRALSSAQSLDRTTVERLTGVNGVGEQAFVTDTPFSAAQVAARVAISGSPGRLAALARERIAPGWLGRDPRAAAAFALLVLCAAAVAGVRLERAAGPRDFYADLARTLRAGVGDSALRVAQLTRLRKQRARSERLLTVVALAVPGAAGFRFGRPLAALIASAACASGLAIALALATAPLDPLAVGILPKLLAQLALLACGLAYALATAAAFVLRVEE